MLIAAQPHNDKLLVMGSPQHLLKRGLSIDLDIKLKDCSWLIISPQYYYNESGSIIGFFNTHYDQMSGGGIGIANRRYLSQQHPFYFTYGAMYHYFDINAIGTERYDFYNYQYIIENRKNIIINRFTGSCTFGYQMDITEHLYFDLYMGFGMRYSIKNDESIPFNNSMLDFGYSGVLFLSGFRLGVGF